MRWPQHECRAGFALLDRHWRHALLCATPTGSSTARRRAPSPEPQERPRRASLARPSGLGARLRPRARYRPLVLTARPMRVERTQGSTRNTRSHGWCVCVCTYPACRDHAPRDLRPSDLRRAGLVPSVHCRLCALRSAACAGLPWPMRARVRLSTLQSFVYCMRPDCVDSSRSV
jgi:hypothetical protein